MMILERVLRVSSAGRLLARALLAFVSASFCASIMSAQQQPKLDKYGGLESAKCSAATGHFRTEKVGSHWWLCTPAGDVFFMVAVYAVEPSSARDQSGTSYYERVAKKYGDNGPAWGAAIDKRLLSWGFNTIGPYSSIYVLPTHPGGRSDKPNLPFVGLVRPSYYSMINSAGLLGQGAAVKDLFYGRSPAYTGYAPSAGVADFFDPNLAKWLARHLDQDWYWKEIKSSAYENYMIGVHCDDGDQLWGFGAGDAFATTPPGHNSPHLGWIVATMSPLQSANRDKTQIYSDPTVFSKRAWIEYLKAKYKTIGALNKAWGSEYSSFDSSGNLVTDELIGTGNGQTGFAGRFAHAPVSRFSLAIYLNGNVVAGDVGDGNIFGPSVIEGHVDYASGQVSLQFAQAPPLGAKIAARYSQNGWEIGSGLADEDGRKSHRAWMGTDFVSLRNASPALKADLDGFLEELAGQFFRTCRDGIKKVFPNILYLGPDTLGTWGAPPREQILQAAGKYLDAATFGGSTGLTQQMIDFVARNFGDKPYYESEYRVANPDSAMFRYGKGDEVHGFQTQADRGKDYLEVVTRLPLRTVGFSGSHPYIGTAWWQFADNLSEKLNWGLVTPFDNAYDGFEDRMARAKDKFGYEVGGEERDYGDALTWITKANLQWISVAQQLQTSNPPR